MLWKLACLFLVRANCLAEVISQSHPSASDHVQRASRNSSKRRLFTWFSLLASMILGNTPWLTLKCLGTGIGVVFQSSAVHLRQICSPLTYDFLPPAAIPLKSELAYEIFDKGQVRFWLQAEHLSPDSSFRFVINDREVSDSEVSSWSELWLRGSWVCWSGSELKLREI